VVQPIWSILCFIIVCCILAILHDSVWLSFYNNWGWSGAWWVPVPKRWPPGNWCWFLPPVAPLSAPRPLVGCGCAVAPCTRLLRTVLQFIQWHSRFWLGTQSRPLNHQLRSQLSACDAKHGAPVACELPPFASASWLSATTEPSARPQAGFADPVLFHSRRHGPWEWEIPGNGDSICRTAAGASFVLPPTSTTAYLSRSSGYQRLRDCQTLLVLLHNSEVLLHKDSSKLIPYLGITYQFAIGTSAATKWVKLSVSAAQKRY
jgi:hypothetical protein